MLIQIKLVRNQNFSGVRNGLCHRQQKFIKLLVKFNSFAQKPFKIASRVHYGTKKYKFFFHFQILITCRSAVLKFWKSSRRKDSSQFFHVQSMYYSIRAIYYIKPNQNYKHSCFRKHLVQTPLSHFVHIALDLLQPMARLFRSE